MTRPDLLTFYDTHCRQAGLGGATLKIAKEKDYTLHLGPWIYVSYWSFVASKMAEILQGLTARARQEARPVIWRVLDGDKLR